MTGLGDLRPSRLRGARSDPFRSDGVGAGTKPAVDVLAPDEVELVAAVDGVEMTGAAWMRIGAAGGGRGVVDRVRSLL